jgi:hypothetical protein
MMWTAAKVREELPDVQVKVGKVIYNARVRGRKNQFATIFWGPSYSAEFAWQTIANCLNNNRPLQV